MGAQLLICGTGPGSGKTMVGCALAFAFKVRGQRVGVMKPIVTGAFGNGAAVNADDAEALAAAASSEMPLERISPYRYVTAAAPIAAAIADRAPAPDYEAIVQGLRAIQSSSDAVIVEETWGLDAAVDESHDFASLAANCQLELILVAARRDGFITEAAKIADCAHRRGLQLRGVILNCLSPAYPADITRDAGRLAQATRVPLLGIVRYKEPLGLAIVQSLA
jgi:dethiobiotin synthetase